MTAMPELPGCVDCVDRTLCSYHQGWRDALYHLEAGALPGPWARALWRPDGLAANLRTWAWDDVERISLCHRLHGMGDRLMP